MESSDCEYSKHPSESSGDEADDENETALGDVKMKVEKMKLCHVMKVSLVNSKNSLLDENRALQVLLNQNTKKNAQVAIKAQPNTSPRYGKARNPKKAPDSKLEFLKSLSLSTGAYRVKSEKSRWYQLAQ